MTFIRFPGTDAAFNLALEEAFFKTLSPEKPELLLIWRNSPSVIVGRHQNTAEEVNAAFCQKNDITIVRRNSGGGTVYHDLGNINFSILVWPEKTPLSGFETFTTPIVQALHDLGIKAECSSRNDILVAGRKVSGTAQLREGQRLLHHGCLLVDTDVKGLSHALSVDLEKFHSKGVASHRARVANLREFLPSTLDHEACVSLVADAIIRRCATEETTIPAGIYHHAEILAEKKYRNWTWNWGKSPSFTEKMQRRFPWGRLECLREVKHGVICSCRLFGDFFALREIEELERLLIGQKADPITLRKTLSQVPLEDWFVGAEKASLLDLLCGDA